MIYKLRSILDETTILNFGFIIKLAKRYKWIVFIAPLFVAVYSGYLFKTQNQIFSSEISFRFLPENKNTGANAISALVDVDESGVTSSEIIGIAQSTNFLQGLAEDLANDPLVEQLDFNSIYDKKKLTFKQHTSLCVDEKCKVDFIRAMVPGLFVVTEDEFIDDKYNISVKSLDPKTTEQILKYVQINILRYRLSTIKSQLKSQISITSRLVDQEEKKVQALGLKKILQEKSILEDSLEALIKKRELYEETLGQKKVELEQAKISLKYTKNTLGRKISSNDKKKYEKLKNLLLRKQLLSADITALEYSIGDKTNNDNSIITNLKNELKKINKEINKLESSKSKGLLGDFQDKKLRSKSTVEFSIKVLNDQIAGLIKNNESINEERSRIIGLIGDKEAYLNNNQAILEYLKLLQAKHLQLKLIEDTIVSDLIFESYLSAKRRYKRYSLFSVIPFSIAIALVLSLILLVIRYAFDDRLFDEEEFRSLFTDIEFIGEIPKVD